MSEKHKRMAPSFWWKLVFVLVWMAVLYFSDSYYIPYLLIGVAGVISLFHNAGKTQELKRRECKLVMLFSAVFSVLVLAANYPLFSGMLCAIKIPVLSGIAAAAVITAVFFGGLFCAGSLLRVLLEFGVNFTWKQHDYSFSPAGIWCISFFSISVLNLLVLFLCYYPGMVTQDSMWQINQTFTGRYTNHHPFYHTLFMQVFFQLGLQLFGEINAAVATYSVVQVLLMAACFSYLIVTLRQMEISAKLIAGCGLFYLLMPYHIMYSFTMWKDILFSGLFLVFLVAVFRIWQGIGAHRKFDYLLALAGSVAICLFRSNGWLAFLIAVIGFFVLFFREKAYRKLLYMMLSVLLVTFVLKHPVLDYWNVSQSDTVESLSIPVQQIARVVKECDDLSEKQRQMLGEIVDLEQVKEEYLEFISDPVKKAIRNKKNLDKLEEHKAEYFKLYLEIGLSHPSQYIAAWIDQTKGYWNGGYPYWRWSKKVKENTRGIERSIHSEHANKLFDSYLALYENVPFLQIFLCIGFFVWILSVCCFMNVIRRNKMGLFLTLPVIAVILSLLVATPVFSEFRYAYAVFCCVPFLVIATFYNPGKKLAVKNL